MKYIKYILVIILLFFITASTQAATRAIFPDPKILQPAPTGSKPNISRNINYSENDYSKENYNYNEQNENIITKELTKNNKGVEKIYLILISILSIILVILVIIKKYVKINRKL